MDSTDFSLGRLRLWVARHLTQIVQAVGVSPRSWLSGTAFFVGIVGIASRAASNDWITQAVQVPSWILLAVSGPVLVYATTAERLKQMTEPLLAVPGDLAEASRQAGENLEAVVRRGFLQYLSVYNAEPESDQEWRDDAQMRQILTKLCLPVTGSVIAAQYGRPLLTESSFAYVLTDLEQSSIGQLAVLHVEISYLANLPPGVGVGSAIAPKLIVDSSALGISACSQLAKAGDADVYWPIPARALGTAPADEIDRIRWIEHCAVRLGEHEIPLAEFARPSGDEIARIFGPVSPALEKSSLAALSAATVMAIQPIISERDQKRIELEVSRKGHLHCRHEFTYRIWVKGAESKIPFNRYAIAFFMPTTVRGIRFSIAPKLQGRVRMTTASVNSAFPLLNDSRRYDPYDQNLEWAGSDDRESVPFLPGHGVTFYWEMGDAG
jgi:hypothetical protein